MAQAAATAPSGSERGRGPRLRHPPAASDGAEILQHCCTHAAPAGLQLLGVQQADCTMPLALGRGTAGFGSSGWRCNVFQQCVDNDNQGAALNVCVPV